MKQFKLLMLLSVLFLVTFVSASTVAPVDLLSAENFVILTKSGISTTGSTSIVGDIGVSPIDSTAITGFGLIMDSSTQFSTSSLINGKAYASDYSSPTPSILTTAIGDMETAYTDAAGRAIPDSTELGAGDIGGLNLAPGLYKWTTDLTIPTDVTLTGDANAVWIFQVAGTLDISSGKKILLAGGAQAKNIFWQVGGQTTLGTDSVFNGIILDQTAIVIQTGAVLNGRAFAQTAVTLDSNVVSLSDSSNLTVNLTTLTIRKIVINNNNGTNNVSDFLLYINDTQVFSNVTNNVSSGTYLVREINLPGYNGTIGGDCNLNGTVSVLAGQNKICTITNDDANIAALNVTNVTLLNVNLSIAPWYPKDKNYIFLCNAQGFIPTSYDFIFGDGHKTLNYLSNNIYHTFLSGSYDVQCIARNSTLNLSSILHVNVNFTNSTNGTVVNQTNNPCFSSVAYIPAVCTGGIITQNTDMVTFDNCRHITCTNGTNSLSVKACEKPSEVNPTYFEMYKINTTTNSIKICLGDACIQNNGFSSQQLPLCLNVTNMTNQTIINETNMTNQTVIVNATLNSALWYPKGHNYVLVCNAQGFIPTSYDFIFGDGHRTLNYSQNNVYHTYASGGYEAQCIARSATQNATGIMHIVLI